MMKTPFKFDKRRLKPGDYEHAETLLLTS